MGLRLQATGGKKGRLSFNPEWRRGKVVVVSREKPRNSPPADPEVPVKDGMHPPTIPEMVQCIHCGEEYDSWRIEWRVFEDEDGSSHGMWCCPMPGCDGKGFGIDIYPVDFPADGCWQDEDGRELQMVWDDDDDEEEGDDVDWEMSDGPDSFDEPADGDVSDDDIPF